ncbi:efflux RND transporter periplasmic adaptor subunit [Actinomycetospora straminea]|uniref:YknX-like beta-barrel domain-containing protein n=1 Tax=Actinomycetospora straminea TaxID=663607 RepID=A0ABP9EB17_9PSEU|nr:HlyD family efflux transporter periplasmic adaptor subunit [Actinomycetospora straminea]MDD7935276.1 efflux RND transporter periplasmic adaptor subunit [Actinomycetospora straminea]
MAGARRSLWLVNGLIVLVVLLAVGGTVIGLTATGGSDDTGLRTTPVGRGTVAETVTASGAVTSAQSSTLNFAVGGRVEDVRVAVGDLVEAGDVVATLDPEYAEANLEAARAQRDAARQSLRDAREARDNPQTSAAAPAQQPAPAGQTPAPMQQGTGTGVPGNTTTGGQATSPCTTCAPAANPAPTTAQPAPPSDQRQQSGPLVEVNGLRSMPAADPKAVPAQPAPPGGGGTGSGTGGGGTTTTAPNAGGGAGGAAGATTPEGQVAQAEASLAQAEASVIQAENATEDLELSSPQDGTVVSLDIGPGQLVPAGGTTTSSTGSGNPTGGTLPDGTAGGTGAAAAAAGAGAGAGAASGSTGGAQVTGAPTTPAALTVLDLTTLQIRADVPELDVGRLAVGQPVEVSVNALPGQALPGTVSGVDLLPGSGSSVQYGTNVTLTGPPPNLRPGMSASVAVTVAQTPNVSFLPSVAVTPIGGEGATDGTVQVLGPDGVPQPRTVGLGLSSDTVTEIRSGLAPGELVVLPDPNTANPFGPGQGPPPSTDGGGNRGGGGGG